MTPTPNRRDRRAAKATAPVVPAVEASAERAAIERDPADVEQTAADPLAAPAADLPAADAAVLPEPTLVAEPGKPAPIVTASPILAVEPSAVDVVQADAAASRVEAGLETAPGPDGPHAAAAGQPTLTIEGGATADTPFSYQHGAFRLENVDVDTVVAGSNAGLLAELTEFRDRDPDGFTQLRRDLGFEPGALGGDEDRVLSLDDIVRGLERLSLFDPVGMDIIGTRFFGDQLQGEREQFAERPHVGPTVTVIEVTGPLQGRRRAGRSFGPQATRFLPGELTEDEIVALRGDPMLAVGVSEVPADAFGQPIAVG